MTRALLILLFATAMRVESPPPCAEWLTTTEVQGALGMEVHAEGPAEHSPGFTLCSWTKDRPEGQLGVHFSFFEPEAMREGPITAESIPEYFDLQVAAKKDESGAEPQKLDGVGKRAVLFSEEYLWIVMIELEEGFAHLAISPTDITREQVEKLAKAAASRTNAS